MGQEPAEIRHDIEETRSQMGETVDALSHKANVPARIKESISDKTERLRHQMASTTSKVTDAAPSTGEIRSGARQAVGIAQENPLGLAIGGAAVGILVGLALPATRIEDERIGPIADDVKETAKETGQEALERGKQVAQEAASAATDAARESGQEQADEMRESVKDSAADMTSSSQATDGEATRATGTTRGSTAV